jgi:hypothetical protein
VSRILCLFFFVLPSIEPLAFPSTASATAPLKASLQPAIALLATSPTQNSNVPSSSPSKRSMVPNRAAQVTFRTKTH